MVEAGYSQATADQGIQAVPKVVLALMPQETNLVDLGAALTAVQQEQLVRGRLMWNTLRGVDKGVASAYRLGQDKRVSMFIPENMTGVVVINSPTAVASSPTVPEDNE